jgi:hypothetical protein
MLLVAQIEHGATKTLHLKKEAKMNQLASCYETRYGCWATGSQHITVSSEKMVDLQTCEKETVPT